MKKKDGIKHTAPSITYNLVMNGILGISNLVFPLVTMPYVSRVLLPEGLGKVSFVTSLVAYLNMLAQLGIPTYGIRACARVRDDREELTRTVQELLVINLVMCAVAYAVMAAALALVPRLRAERPLCLVLGVTVILNAVGMEWLYKGLEQYAYITVRSVVFKAAAVAVLPFLVRERQDYLIYGGITVLASSASYVCNLFHARRYVDLWRVRGKRLHPLRHLGPVCVFFAMSCSVVVYTNLDTVMLGFMKGDAEVGLYNAAVRLKTILITLVSSLGSVLLPRASYYAETGRTEELQRLGNRALRFAASVSLPMAVYLMLFARESVLFFSGPAYGGSVAPMRILMPTLVLIGLSNILGIQVLVPLGREKAVLLSEAAGAVTDLVLNLLLIPGYGAAGAAVGTLAAEAVVLAVQFGALGKERMGLIWRIPWGRLFPAAGVAGVVSRIAADLWFAGQAAAGEAEISMAGYFLELLVSGVVFAAVYGGILLLWGGVRRFRARQPG